MSFFVFSSVPKVTRWLAASVAAAMLTGCKRPPPPSPDSTSTEPSAPGEISEVILAAYRPPLPASYDSKTNPSTDAKIKLGRMLYYDPRLSASKKISCNSCHLLDKYGVDGKKVSLGHEEQPGKRNSPSVYNAAGHFVQFWDGRAADVEEQAKGPILNLGEMAMAGQVEVVAEFRLERARAYVDLFKEAFPNEPDAINFDNIARAIGAFERKLVTPARWDKFLGGEKDAITAEEKRGFQTFVSTGCNACHMGTLVGGSMYQKLGLAIPWPNLKDEGRFEETKNADDKMKFKVPSLRNVEKTAPYFHDGSVATLDEAVRLMGKHQLGKDLKADDVAAIVTWLKSLTGTLPTDYIRMPTLPAMPSDSAMGTPKVSPAASAGKVK